MVSPILLSRHASWLTHGSMLLLVSAYGWLLVAVPFGVAFVPAVIVAHRIGTLLHEYIHGIPCRRYRDNHAVVTAVDGLLLTFGTMEMFRVDHLQHHKWLNTDDDHASATVAKTGQSKLRSILAGVSFLQYLLGLWDTVLGRRPQVSRPRMLLSALLSAAMIVAWNVGGHGDVVAKIFLVTVVTMLGPVSLRAAIEHHNAPAAEGFANEYRVVVPLFNLNRHIHHHEDPTLPWYLLEWRTPRPLQRLHYLTTWFRVYVTREYRLMRPMRASDVRRGERLALRGKR
ncbi:MAG: fatty acid desaturase [Gemmatimonadaceae bacterium]